MIHARAPGSRITWTIIGSTPLSGTFQGIDEVSSKLFAGLRAALDGPVEFTIGRLIAEGDYVGTELVTRQLFPATA